VNQPYTHSQLTSTTFTRYFSSTVDPTSLIWHQDQHDREIRVISGIGWSIQLDNELPTPLVIGQVINIPALVYHRVIAGPDDLVLHITETFSEI
jgi:quercetin dioxygenase-like cupin family protein